jgi:predicted nucleic acid-binding Zn ribbon protein
VSCRFCHSKKGCYTWLCYSCGEIDDVQQPAAQPEQEPVVFYRCNGCGHAYEQVHPTSCDCMDAGGFDRVEYFTTPPAAQRKPLTHDEIEAIGDKVANEKLVGPVANFRVRFARAIEAAHGIKENT